MSQVNLLLLQGCCQCLGRRIHGLVCQDKGAPVHRHRVARLDFLVYLPASAGLICPGDMNQRGS